MQQIPKMPSCGPFLSGWSRVSEILNLPNLFTSSLKRKSSLPSASCVHCKLRSRHLQSQLLSCHRYISTSAKRRKKKDYYEDEKVPIMDYGSIRPEKKRLYVFGQAAHGGLGLHKLLRPEKEHEKVMLFMRRPVRNYFGDLHKIQDIAAGHGFTLISVKPDKENGPVLYGCGYNLKSQLGCQLSEREKPLVCLINIVPVALPLDRSSKVLALAAGRGHSLISVEGKGILALGENTFGQCGRNIIEDEQYLGSKYVCRIPRFGSSHDYDVVEMASRFDVSICVTKLGEVYTFGCNDQGQLGRGKDVSKPWIPKALEGDLKGERVTKVATNGFSVLAISEKGELFGWGSNDCGQVNPGEISNIYYHPVRVKLPRRLGKIVDIAIGDMFSFILNEFGNVYTWGSGRALGLGPKTTYVKTPTIIPPPLFGRNQFSPDTAVVKIASSFKFAAAVTSVGDLYTWGYNDNGCLGLGPLQTDYQHFPFKVAMGGGPVHKICLGVDHTVVMTKAGF